MPLLIRGTGVGNAMEPEAGPPGVFVFGPDIGSNYTVVLPGEGSFSHIIATGQPNQWGGANVMIDSMLFDPANRSFTFRVADYAGGGIPIVLLAVLNDLVAFTIFVDNK